MDWMEVASATKMWFQPNVIPSVPLYLYSWDVDILRQTTATGLQYTNWFHNWDFSMTFQSRRTNLNAVEAHQQTGHFSKNQSKTVPTMTDWKTQIQVNIRLDLCDPNKKIYNSWRYCSYPFLFIMMAIVLKLSCDRHAVIFVYIIFWSNLNLNIWIAVYYSVWT